jgi:4-amino-4-deoxy-L-arabinose transferase-like glycosyltransferase
VPNNHVFHSVLVWISIRLFGEAQWAIRLPALIAGILMVPAAYFVGLELSSARAGLLAAALVAVWPKLILFSTNARGYTIVGLAFLVLLYLAVKLLEEESRALWAAFTLVIFLGTYTIPTMLYPAAGAVAWLAVEKVRRAGIAGARDMAPRLAGSLAISVSLTVLAYTPVIRSSGLSALAGNRYVTPLPLHDFLRELALFPADLRYDLGYGVPTVVQLVLGCCVVLALLRPPVERTARITLTICVAGSCLVLLALSRRVPPTRVLLYIVPLLCVFAGIGLNIVLVRVAALTNTPVTAWSGAAASLLVLGLGSFIVARDPVVSDPGELTISNARDIADLMRARTQHGERVVMSGGAKLFDYYLRQSGHRLSEYVGPRRTGSLLVIEWNPLLDSPMKDPRLIVANRTELHASAYGPPVLLRRFPQTDVYEMPITGHP